MGEVFKMEAYNEEPELDDDEVGFDWTTTEDEGD